MKQISKRRSIRSLRNTVWVYFVIFITSILVLMWFAFVVSLEASYKRMKTKNILSIATYIINGWGHDDFTAEKLDEIAYDNDMCILIENSYGYNVYSYDMMADNCLIHGLGSFNLFRYRAEALLSDKGYYYAEVQNPRFKNNTLLFVTVVGSKNEPDGFIYLNTSVEPLKSTADILKTQVLWISVMMFILGLGIAYFLARIIEAPLARITRSATKLGDGDYSVSFDGHGYNETELLADTLNYAASEISKVDSLRRDLIANISHDLRTPLTMVKAYAEMIRDLSGDNPEKRSEHINIIIEESDRLATLVNDILDLSRLESGNSEMNITRFCITDKINEIMDRYTLFSEQKGYTFIVSADSPFMVEADVVKIQQVLYNLINNAINYTGSSKTVYITQIIKDADTVRIEVTDTGEGIDAELIPLIFDRYYRAEKSKREVIGTGLGLSIVKQILKQHNCEFGVCSEKNVGSTFWFEMKGELLIEADEN